MFNPDHHDQTIMTILYQFYPIVFSVNWFDWSGKSAYAVTQKPASFRSRFSHHSMFSWFSWHLAELQWFMDHLVMILLHIHHFFCDSNSKNHHHKDHPIVIIHHSSSPLSQKMEQWDYPTHSSFIIIIIFLVPSHGFSASAFIFAAEFPAKRWTGDRWMLNWWWQVRMRLRVGTGEALETMGYS